MTRTEQDVIQNLKDAGCGKDVIDSFMGCYRSRETVRGLRLLSDHRQSLLDQLHAEQKRIDCLDYLIYQLKQG